MNAHLQMDRELLQAFCRKWEITDIWLFGSVLRDDFTPKSDVDVMVSFQPDVRWSLLDFVDMREELKTIFGRDVDLLTRRSLERSENWIRRENILNSAERIYAQG